MGNEQNGQQNRAEIITAGNGLKFGDSRTWAARVGGGWANDR